MISLNDMSRLANALVDADAEVESITLSLKAATERARVLREETIPSAMQEIGLTKLKLETGQEVEVKQEVYASIPAASKAAAFKWLVDNGFGALIKTEVSVEFGKGQKEEATAFYQRIASEGLFAEFNEGVHAQTLKAFLKEQISAGKDVPMELFGARPVWQAKIKNPK